MNTEEFTKMYCMNLWHKSGITISAIHLAQQIDKHFISTEKHLLLLEKAKLKDQKLDKIISQNQELLTLLTKEICND